MQRKGDREQAGRAGADLSDATRPYHSLTPLGMGTSGTEWHPLARAGSGAERAGGARSQGILPPTPARPRWGRESMGWRGSAMHALPGAERAGGVRSQGILPPLLPAPAGGGSQWVGEVRQCMRFQVLSELKVCDPRVIPVLRTMVIRWRGGVTLV